MIGAKNLSVLLLRRLHVLHVVSPDITCKGLLRYILVNVVEPNPTGRFKRTFKLSKLDMDVVTGFMDTV